MEEISLNEYWNINKPTCDHQAKKLQQMCQNATSLSSNQPHCDFIPFYIRTKDKEAAFIFTLVAHFDKV